MNFNNKHAHVPLLNTTNCSYLCVYYANAKEFLIVFFSFPFSPCILLKCAHYRKICMQKIS